MIAIKSKKELTFDPVSRQKGYVTVEIESYSRNAQNKTFTLNLIDTVSYMADVKRIVIDPPQLNSETGELITFEPREEIVSEKKTKSVRRGKSYSDTELLTLAAILGEEEITTANILLKMDVLFQKGLLLTTQLECQQGKGIYFSSENDWEMI